MKTKVSAKLEPGQDVAIIGEQDEYFKIKPPKDVYLYVNKQFVDPVKQVAIADGAGAPGAPANNATPTTAPSGNEIAIAPTDSPTTAPTTAPTLAEAPSTQPTDQKLALEQETLFDQLEAQIAQVDKQPLDQQPLAQLLASYQTLSTSTVLPESMRRMSEYRVKVIQGRLDDQSRFAEVKKLQEETKSKQVALQAERDELEQRIKATGVEYFTAVGTLRVSSLQSGQGTLYRLTDPASGRTLVYLRSDDNKLGAQLGQFIGVKGQVAEDPQLKLKTIAPTEFTAVDPAKVNSGIAAQIIPPSMMSGGATATTGNE